MSKMRYKDEPNMSDTTILMSVEDLINIAMGPQHKNVINYKLIQTVLHILARQMRMLEQRVEIRITEQLSPLDEIKGRTRKVEASIDSSSRKSPRSVISKDHIENFTEVSKQSKDKEKAEHAVQKEEKYVKEKGKADRTTQRQVNKGEKARLKEGDKIIKEKEEKDRATSKEREKAEINEKEKEERTISKEREKSQKATAREKEKGERTTSKERGKVEERETEEKETEKLDKVTAKEREKGVMKTRDKDEKATQIEKEQAEMEAKLKLKSYKKGKIRAGSGTSIAISGYSRGRESIEVVTRSQFKILEAMVNDLEAMVKEIAGPLPTPALPENKKLRSELARGSASLTDIMNAMQVSARVKAAEQAIGRMGDLLTELAAAGALPDDFAERIVEVQFEPHEQLDTLAAKSRVPAGKSVVIDSSSIKSFAARSVASDVSPSKMSVGRSSVASHLSTASALSTLPKVTRLDMDDALRSLKEDLLKNMHSMTTKAAAAAETAVSVAKSVAAKLDVAIQLNDRISTLHSLVSDYAEQLSGFDAGISTQMQGFQEQMMQLRSDLRGGLTQFEQVNNNAETAAVLELTEHYEGLVSELDHTLHLHKSLTTFQNQLGDELHNLVECVEMLREQKADRDEVLDGLRDKADNSRLAGLLSEIEFTAARAELERRLEVCYDKFYKQDNVWMGAIKELSHIAGTKAELMQLLAMKDETQQQLRELHEKLQMLELALGEPKAAMLTRKLSRDATCGACMVPALMEPVDASHGAPPPLPALRPRPTGAPAEETEEPCLKDWKLPEFPNNRDHICHRWCGGSHTLVSDAIAHKQAVPIELQSAPTKRFTGYGSDGRMYMMEEELQPCLECNVVLDQTTKEAPPPSEDGAGDHGNLKHSVIGDHGRR
ncbi:cingulin-like [Galleria mellonella]|uniref:Cingulin-like n=1 Tax=Galleria mellonella TaxID=7137 RepID=A0ABM3MH30_GALME|nr:cingulin-like [Galleria mellonella]